ncbi:partial Secretory immunoglobulin A-binding protein EsiB, partial [uncultured bacterium]
GCVDARLFIGKRYMAGDGLPRNLQRAEQYLRGAAEAGLAEAQAVLGELYLIAEPPLADPVKAAAWLAKAVAQRYPAAYFALSELYERGTGVAKDLKKADELLLQAADFGEPKAQLKIAKYYLTGAFGHTFAQNYRAALDWFKRASAHGVAEAEYEVGLRYERNEGVDRPDMALAASSYLKAAEMGYAPAQHRIGQVYLYGQGVNQNLREARRWFSAAAAQGHVEAAKLSLKLQGAVSDGAVIGRVDAAQSDSATDWKG